VAPPPITNTSVLSVTIGSDYLLLLGLSHDRAAPAGVQSDRWEVALHRESVDPLRPSLRPTRHPSLADRAALACPLRQSNQSKVRVTAFFQYL
jgi:hypothetical protein